MKVFTCKDRLEDIMTCIYDAWSEALQIGHDQIQLKKEPTFQQTIFDEYIHVDQDASKAEKVIRSIFLMKHIWIFIWQHYLRRKMHCRQFIISFGSDFRWVAMHCSNMRIRM